MSSDAIAPLNADHKRSRACSVSSSRSARTRVRREPKAVQSARLPVTAYEEPMTEHYPEKDVPQVDFDVHTGDPVDQEDFRDTGGLDGDTETETTNPKKEQS